MTKFATDVYFELNNGIKIPALGLGTVKGDKLEDTKFAVKTAVKAGIRHIDTAWYYGTEQQIGEAIKELIEEGIVKREELFVTTKVWPSFHHNPAKSLEKSLSDLGLTYVDLLLQHWPITLKGDENGLPSLPKDASGGLVYDKNGSFIETYHKLEALYHDKKGDGKGKVRSIGVSNYSIPLLQQLLEDADVVPVVNQIELHPQLPQQDLVDFSQKHHILIEAYSPVGSTGAPVLKLPLIEKLAKKYNVSTNEIATSYHIQSGRIVLPRSTNLKRIENEFVHLAELTDAELKELYEIGVQNPKRYINDATGYGLGFKYWAGDDISFGA